MKSLDNDLYALRAEWSERSRRQHKWPGRSNYKTRNWSRDNLQTVLEIHKIETEQQQEDPTGLETNLEKIQEIDQMIEYEVVENILNRNPTNIVTIVIKRVILGNTVGRCNQK